MYRFIRALVLFIFFATAIWGCGIKNSTETPEMVPPVKKPAREKIKVAKDISTDAPWECQFFAKYFLEEFTELRKKTPGDFLLIINLSHRKIETGQLIDIKVSDIENRIEYSWECILKKVESSFKYRRMLKLVAKEKAKIVFDYILNNDVKDNKVFPENKQRMINI